MTENMKLMKPFHYFFIALPDKQTVELPEIKVTLTYMTSL